MSTSPAIETVDLQREFSRRPEGGRRHRPRRRARRGLRLPGPNGAGKTTTVRMLATLLRPDRRPRDVAGHDVADEARRRCAAAIGVALQEAALDPLMTGRELLRAAGALHGIPRRTVARPRRRADRARRPGRRPPTAASAPTRAACAAAWTWRWRSSTSPRCCSSTSRPPAWTRRAAPTLWDEVRRAATTRARPSSSPRSTSRRPTSSPTASGSSTPARIVAEGTPAALKAEVGEPAPRHQLADGARRRGAAPREVARAASATPRPRADGCHVSLQVADGAGAIAPVVRALDEAGLRVESHRARARRRSTTSSSRRPASISRAPRSAEADAA